MDDHHDNVPSEGRTQQETKRTKRAGSRQNKAMAMSKRRALETLVVPLFLTASLLTRTASHVHSIRSVETLPASSIPPPWLDTHALCRPLTHATHLDDTASVCDPSALLSEDEIDSITEQLRQIYQGRWPYSPIACPPGRTREDATGFRVTILLLRRLPVDSKSMSDRTKAYANAIFRHWHLSANCGASVLLFLSLEDRRLYLQTGSLSANFISEHKIDNIFQEMAPYLSQNDIKSALQTAISSISTQLQKYDNPTLNNRPQPHPQPQLVPPIPHKPHNTPPQSNPQEEDERGISGPLFLPGGPAWWDLELSLIVITCAFCLLCACCHGVGGKAALAEKHDRANVLRKLNTARLEYVRAMLPQYAPLTCSICQEALQPLQQPAHPLSTTDDMQQATESDPLTAGMTPPANTTSEPSPPAVYHFRCGHAMHESCLVLLGPRDNSTSCPSCGDSSWSMPTASPLSETRGRDFQFRLSQIRKEFPHLFSPGMQEHLLSTDPTGWPDALDESFFNSVSGRGARMDGGGDSGWSGWGLFGGLLAAGGLGALVGSAFSGAFGGGDRGGGEDGDGEGEEGGGEWAGVPGSQAGAQWQALTGAQGGGQWDGAETGAEAGGQWGGTEAGGTEGGAAWGGNPDVGGVAEALEAVGWSGGGGGDGGGGDDGGGDDGGGHGMEW